MSAKAKSKLTPEQRNATLRRVLEKIRPYGFFVVCSLIVAAVSVAAQLYIPILCGSAIDMMLGKGNVDFNGVLRIVVEIVIVAVVAAFAQWLLSVCNNRITFSVSRDLRNAALRKIQTLPLSYLDSHPSGDIVSRMVADVDTFADGLLMGFTQLFSGVLTILGTLLFMLSENVPITLVVVCITPLSLVVASFLAKRSYKYFQGQSTVRGEQTALVNEMIEGQKVVQAFGHEAESLAAFDEVNGRLQSVSLKAIFFSSMTNPATRFVNNIVYAGVGLVGAVYAVAGGITIGQLSIFLNYANQYTKPFNEISGVVTELQNALACAARVFELLDAEDRPHQGELVVDPATAKKYQYQFVGTPNDDRFTIAINGGLHILLCIWQEDDTLTLRDHKNGLAVVGTIPAKGSLTELMMQGDEALVKYKEHRWHIAVKSQLTAEEDLPECTPSALVAHAFHAYRQTEDNGRERLEHELLGMEERLCFQWFWMDEKEWDFDHIGPLLDVDKVAGDPQEMMRLALVYDNFCAFMRRLSALSYKNGGRIEVDQLQARNNKRKIARCVRHIAKHRSGEINIWELEESAREEIVKLFRIFRNEFVKELEAEG